MLYKVLQKFNLLKNGGKTSTCSKTSCIKNTLKSQKTVIAILLNLTINKNLNKSHQKSMIFFSFNCTSIAFITVCSCSPNSTALNGLFNGGTCMNAFASTLLFFVLLFLFYYQFFLIQFIQFKVYESVCQHIVWLLLFISLFLLLFFNVYIT